MRLPQIKALPTEWGLGTEDAIEFIGDISSGSTLG